MHRALLTLLLACSAPAKPPPQLPPQQPPAAQPVAAQPPAADEPGCPADHNAAIGTTCPTEGQVCNQRAVQQATGFSNLLVCRDGAWRNIEVPPPQPK